MRLFSLIALCIWVLLTSKSHQNQPQAIEMFKSANELLDNASKLPLEKQNAKEMFELVKPNLFGIVCDVKFESAKIDKNLQKLHENFCGQMNEGKSIGEIAQKMKKTVTNTETDAINHEICEKMPQKIQKLAFLNGKNKEMLSAFVGHLLVGNNFLTKIAAHIQNVIITNKNNKCSAKNRGQRRTKRGDDLECGECLDCLSNCEECPSCCCFDAYFCFALWLLIGVLSLGTIGVCGVKIYQSAAQISHLIIAMVVAGILLLISIFVAVTSWREFPDRSSG